jgi:hypothetical protein
VHVYSQALPTQNGYHICLHVSQFRFSTCRAYICSQKFHRGGRGTTEALNMTILGWLWPFRAPKLGRHCGLTRELKMTCFRSFSMKGLLDTRECSPVLLYNTGQPSQMCSSVQGVAKLLRTAVFQRGRWNIATQPSQMCRICTGSSRAPSDSCLSTR